ncbi:MAG: histidine phosphatase family protein [Pseudohongiella sp.]|nr:histidine phosphatase family protein [Pseudohongiella sp.]MDO9520719.1 histidine phosphatase family protein [Pseudohongiella sp.]MDP2126996.1 histidine phosphatase family protein [Pseudohongiella sp.]
MSSNPVIRKIHLIRHGETNWNKDKRAQGQLESVLTPDGMTQAQELKTRLQGIPITEVYCSSSVRTRQTADILFGDRLIGDLVIPIVYCDQLREIHMGPWQGLLYSELREKDPDQFHAFWHQPEKFALVGAETYQDVQRRAIKRLDEILQQSSAEDIAIVSHGVLIKTILCDAEQRPLAQLWDGPAMHNCARSEINIHADGSRRICVYSDRPYK